MLNADQHTAAISSAAPTPNATFTASLMPPGGTTAETPSCASIQGRRLPTTAPMLAKNTYMSDGNVRLPVVITTAIGGGYSDAAQHSQCLYGTFAHMPGLKIVVPSNAYEGPRGYARLPKQ